MDKRFSEMTFPERLSAYESTLSEVSRLKAQLGEYSRKMIDAADELIAWKDASGLECGGDPDLITPAKAKEFWDAEAKRVEALQAQVIEHQADIVALEEAVEHIVRVEAERDEAQVVSGFLAAEAAMALGREPEDLLDEAKRWLRLTETKGGSDG